MTAQIAFIMPKTVNEVPKARWPRWVFAALCMSWLLLLGLPCLQQNEAMRFAEDAVLALMAAVILLAVHTAWCGGEPANATLFTVAELLYCGSY